MRTLKFAVSTCLLLAGCLHAQELSQRPTPEAPKITPAPGKVPNSHAMYQQLRAVTPSGENSSANNLVLQRDAGTFTFKTGTFYFLAPVNGKVTGAVFIGDGSFTLDPPLASEKRSLSLLTKEPGLHEDFNSLVLRFTDGTYEEIKKQAGVANGSPAGLNELNEINNALKKKIHYNLTGRLLQDVMSSEPGGAFIAFINGRKYNSKEVFAVDPHGTLGMEPEEVVFRTWDENKFGTWAAFHYSHEYKNGTASGTQANGVIDMQHHLLDTQFDKSGKLTGDATTTFTAVSGGTQVIPADLFPTLRVSSVTGQGGEALDFIQEGKDDDPDFYVILPKPLAAGESYTMRTLYSGKDAISNEGGGNYYPIARSTWYPNNGLKDYATYDLRFRLPKGMKVAATGQKIKEAVEGDWNVSEWKSRTYQSVAGFNFGDFKTESLKIATMDFEVETYANPNIPDWLKGTEFSNSMSPPSMMKKAMAEAQLSIPLYTDYFGPTSFKHIAMTQQTAGNYGQAWPELVYMPLTSFLDSTQRFSLMGFDPKGYFTVVGPHEIAHQWWGHTVGWSSYRDQWMSEGFSQLSASLFLQMTRDNKQFIKFWNDELEAITEKNRFGFRAIDVGPVTMGYRLSNSLSGFDITQKLIYPKGGYILHMIRMMMWDRRNGDENFKQTMRDFVKTYSNRPASTEDFKAMVEKHMTPEMDMDGNRKMDWFFDPYVYGTVLPSYKFEQTIENGPNGAVLNFKLTQSKVPDNFKMPVPVYVELMDGKVTRLGSANMFGNTTVSQSVPLGQLKVKRAVIAYYNDVLGMIEK
jgi:hypothetical protein